MGQELLPAAPTSPRHLDEVLQPRLPRGADETPGAEPMEVIGRVLAALRRYKWLLMAIVAAGTAASVTATRFVKPHYEVQATIWIASATPQGKTVGPFRAEELVNTSAWPDLLTSYAILDSVVLKVGLYVQPDEDVDAPLFRNFALGDRFRPGKYRITFDGQTKKYTLSTAEGLKVEQGAIGDSVGKSLGFRWAPAPSVRDGRTVKFSVVRPRTASLELRKNLSTSLPTNANLLRIGLQGEHAERITTTTNTLLHQFISTAATLKKRNLVELARTLDEQLTYAQAQLRDAEIALENFRVNTITLPSEGVPVAGGVQMTRDPVLTSYFTQKIDYDNIVHDRAMLEQTLAEIRAGTADVSALWFVNAVQSGPPELRNALTEYATKSASLRAAQQVFTNEHRSVRDLNDAIRELREQTIPKLAASLLAQLRERESALNQRIGSAGKELREIPTRTIEEMRLTRNVAVRENLYTTLKNRFEEARLANESAIPDVSILDSAVVPQAPSTNTTPRIVLAGVVGSLGIAILLAFALDRFDPRFRYPDQISRDLRLEILGVVPAIDPGSNSPDSQAQVIESFRSMRLALGQAFAETGTPTLTVSSPGPADGKSIVCANLAISFASGGYRTLLIDGDIRRGDLHTTLGVKRTPGLTDVLLGNASVLDAVRATQTDRLWILPSGTRSAAGPELLTSERLFQMLRELRNRFDVIIVDSAPLGAGIDGFALAAATHNLALVMRAGQTDRKLAEAKLRVLDRLPVNVLGAVLNGIRAKGAYQYYGYLSGYASELDNLEQIATQRASVG